MTRARGRKSRLRRQATARDVHIHELLLSTATVAKLGARGIGQDEPQQLLDNSYGIFRNNGRGRTRRERTARRLLIGRTNGGRALTLVVEMTADPTIWMTVTGWVATPSERKMIGERR